MADEKNMENKITDFFIKDSDLGVIVSKRLQQSIQNQTLNQNRNFKKEKINAPLAEIKESQENDNEQKHDKMEGSEHIDEKTLDDNNVNTK